MTKLFRRLRISFFHRFLLTALLLGTALNLQGQQPGMVPINPQPLTDKQGNSWYVEQNGMLSRQGGGNSILSGAMMLIMGNDQFYCNQPMGTPDGKELFMTGQQPMMGLQVSRSIRFLEKEGGLRYLEMFTNTTANDVTATVELRQNFNGQVKGLVTNQGRPNNGTLEKDESGIAVLPGGMNVSSYLFTLCGPRSTGKPRIASQNQYQMSFFYTFTVPAGKTASVLHTVTQGKLSVRPDAADLEKILRPFELSRQLRDLPKGTAPTLVNLKASGSGPMDIAAWFPDEILGVKREMLDVLAMKEGTRLRGRATCARFTVNHRLGKIIVPWEKVIALTGGKQGDGEPRVYLADGQILRGDIQAEELQFVMASGVALTLEIGQLDRLVKGGNGEAPVWPKEISALVELASGERWAITQGSSFPLVLSSPWGVLNVKLEELATLTPPQEDAPAPLAVLANGTKIRVWLGAQDAITVPTVSLGVQKISGVKIQAIVVGQAVKADEDFSEDEEVLLAPVAELTGGQRLVAPVAEAKLHAVTAGGVVALDPASIKEMRNVSEDIAVTGTDEAPWFQMELWGGGNVLGQLREATVRFRMPGGEWTITAQDIARVVNPSPKITEATLARIGQLLRDLGHEDWKTREKAMSELRGLGEMAKPSLQEGFKQTEDAEVKRRIETLLSESN